MENASVEPEPIRPDDTRLTIGVSEFAHYDCRSVFWEANRLRLLPENCEVVAFVIERVEWERYWSSVTKQHHIKQVFLIAIRPANPELDSPVGWLYTDGL